MFQHNLALGKNIHHMMSHNPHIRDTLVELMRQIICIIQTERFDPLTVKFDISSPAGLPDKVVVLLSEAQYSKAPINEAVLPSPADPNNQLLGFVDSLYKALMENNPTALAWIRMCPSLCATLFSVAAYIYNHYFSHRRWDFRRPMIWEAAERTTGYVNTLDGSPVKDLLITSNIPR